MSDNKTKKEHNSSKLEKEALIKEVMAHFEQLSLKDIKRVIGITEALKNMNKAKE